MPATRYKIWQVGDRVDDGASQSFHVGVAGIAKKRSDQQPLVVANELLCVSLARAILLPVPPGFIIEHESSPCYVSLNFNLAGEDLPPASPAGVVSQDPALACGIVLFDIWVTNCDRHDRNLMHDRGTGRVQVFDHSHALFGPNGGRGQLESHRKELGIAGHCLAPEIVNPAGMHTWNERIKSVPDYYIRGIVEAAVAVGLPDTDRDFCADFLLERRTQLLDLIANHRETFPKMQYSLLNPDG